MRVATAAPTDVEPTCLFWVPSVARIDDVDRAVLSLTLIGYLILLAWRSAEDSNSNPKAEDPFVFGLDVERAASIRVLAPQ